MRFARITFNVAGIYGLLLLLPYYFLEETISREMPPAITHPEFFYGFVGCAVAWQVAFLFIARDPLRYRPLMIPAIIEKWSFGGASLVLYARGRIATSVMVFAGIDLLLGCLFLAAFFRCGRGETEPRA
jgi:hypothetical protein